MNEDIIARLNTQINEIRAAWAFETIALRAENEKLRAALKPFAVDSLMDDAPTVAHYRAAKAALGGGDE